MAQVADHASVEAFVGNFFDVLENPEANESLKKSFKESGKMAAKAGGAVMLGGAAGGPAGALVGGAIGLIWGYMTAQDFEPMLDLRNLPSEDRITLGMALLKVGFDVAMAPQTITEVIIRNPERVFNTLQSFIH